MWAFDLIELNGDDVRRDPLAVRKATLERMLARTASGIRFNEHLDEEDGPLVFHHACKLGLEGIVSKRREFGYYSGRSPHWIKSKNPEAPAVRRELEEDCVEEDSLWQKRQSEVAVRTGREWPGGRTMRSNLLGRDAGEILEPHPCGTAMRNRHHRVRRLPEFYHGLRPSP